MNNILRNLYDRPWSEIGDDVSDEIMVAQALEKAGAGFKVEVVPACFRLNDSTDIKNASNYNFIIRDDTQDVLGVCKERFVPLQNYVLIDIVQPLINSGKAQLDTIGVFGKGEKVWMLIKLPEHSFQIVDTVETYLLLVNGNDGSTSMMLGVVPFRLACTNQLPTIGQHMIKFRHTENAEEMLGFFRLKLSSQLQKSKEYIDKLKTLVSKPVTSDQLQDYFRDVLELGKGELSTRGKNKLQILEDMYYGGRAAIPGHWYGAFNAVTEYLSYSAGRTQESRLNSLWFGKNSEVNFRALKLAIERSK